MPWGKLDDQWYDHPKTVAVGTLGAGLFAMALSWSAGKLTEGFIPRAMILRLCADIENPVDLADRLVAAGLFESADGGYQIHDYLDYNPSAARVKEIRKARAEAGQLGGQRSKPARISEVDEKQSGSKAEAKAEANEKRKGTPSPSPSPSPSPIPNPEAEEPAAALFIEAVAIWEDMTGRITERTRQQFDMAAEEYGEERLLYAVKEAHDHNAKSWAYVEAILEGRAKSRDGPQLSSADLVAMTKEYAHD